MCLTGLEAGEVGLVLTYAVTLIGNFQWTVRQSAEVENMVRSRLSTRAVLKSCKRRSAEICAEQTTSIVGINIQSDRILYAYINKRKNLQPNALDVTRLLQVTFDLVLRSLQEELKVVEATGFCSFNSRPLLCYLSSH